MPLHVEELLLRADKDVQLELWEWRGDQRANNGAACAACGAEKGVGWHDISSS